MSLAGIENRVSILDSILDSREDRELTVNLLLNGNGMVYLFIVYWPGNEAS